MSPQRIIRRTDRFVRQWWPVIAVSAFIVLGFIAFVIIGNLVADVQDAQTQNAEQANAIATNQRRIRDGVIANRRLNCAIAKAITANPLVRIPQFETEAAFRRRVTALHLILRLTAGIDCSAVLAPVSTGAVKPEPLPGLQLAPTPTAGQPAAPSNPPSGGHRGGGGGNPTGSSAPPGPTGPGGPHPGGGSPGGGGPLCENPVLPVCIRLGL